MNQPARIDLLMTGHTLDAIKADHGDFGEWFGKGLGAGATLRTIDLTDGELPPDISDSDGWIISGSASSVNDDLDWLPRAEAAIRAATADGHPILGVCFGHQLLAKALGGEVIVNPAGWELGALRATLADAASEDALFGTMPTSFGACASHKDTVVALPPDSTLLAQNEKGVQAFKVGQKSYGVQFHPEFTLEIARAYVDERRAQVADTIVWPETGGLDARIILSRFLDYLIEGKTHESLSV